MQQTINYIDTTTDEELNIDLKKILYAFYSRKDLIIKIFSIVLIFFILLTFILPKKYKVNADLYINKANNTNMVEFNPYVLEEAGVGGGLSALMGGNSSLINEIELMQSPLVIDKVIKENDLRYRKKWGIIPNKKEGEYLTTDSFLGKNLKIDVKKGTNVVTIEYKSKNPIKAYTVITSIITNYIDLRKDLISDKSKSDTSLLEAEYEKIKKDLNNKISASKGLPSSTIDRLGNVAIMSSFSKSAGSALASIKAQSIVGEKSAIAIKEDTDKLSQIAQKLQWAKLVEEMSDSSKVVVLKEPVPPRTWEYDSPKLIINILLGIIFGIIAAFFTVLILEYTDKKVALMMLGNHKIIYNVEKEFNKLYAYIITNKEKQITFILLEELSKEVIKRLSAFKNIQIIRAKVSTDFLEIIKQSDCLVSVVGINKTKTQDYKLIKNIVKDFGKEFDKEIIV
jgi:uncharacterized protein involved in exopolysaccharide biosynthesis